LSDVSKNNRRDPALERALKEAGGAAKVARHFGISVQSVWGWRRCPPRRAVGLEKLSKVPRRELRPDVFGGRSM
jgi:DNA-binding transcriptional regulator YdaS (Cro superfamily)